MRDRKRRGKEDSPSLATIGTQPIKMGQFIFQQIGLVADKKVNGRKQHVVTDTLGLVWGVGVHAVHRADGASGRANGAPLNG